jgi:hypothetical protein
MKSWIKLAGFVAATALVLTFAPQRAAAQDAVLYEVSETMTPKGGKITRRVAKAALLGTVRGGTAVCPEAYTSCSITVFARDSVNVSTGRGPVNGEFAIVVQDQNTVDGPEVVLFEGSLVGKLDLSPSFSGTPIGTISGTWTSRKPATDIERNGTFTGTFRLPFAHNGVPSYFVSPTEIVPIGPNERALGTPLVRLELDLQ